MTARNEVDSYKGCYRHTEFAGQKDVLAGQSRNQVLFKDTFEAVADRGFIPVDCRGI